MKGRRAERLAEEIREQVASIVSAKLKDPRIGFVTVTRVELAPDASFARVFCGVLGDRPTRDATLAALAQASGFVRRELGRRIRLRLLPEVRFEYDKGLDAADRVAQLLGEIGSAEAADAEARAETDPETDPKDDPEDDPEESR